MAHQLLIIAYSCDVNQIRDQGARSRPVVAAIMVDIAEWNCRKGRQHGSVTVEHSVSRGAAGD